MALRQDVATVAPDFDTRVMQRIRAEPPGVERQGVWSWMTRPRTVTVSPLGVLALAAGFAGVVVLAARGRELTVPQDAVAPGGAIATAAPVPQMTRFVFVARSASSVAIVGDFNDWQEAASPMRRESEGVWAITIPLAPGRYHYTFVVDGTKWVADPLAPRTIEDDFGRPNSVITVGEATT
jgi:hypothetical protein